QTVDLFSELASCPARELATWQSASRDRADELTNTLSVWASGETQARPEMPRLRSAKSLPIRAPVRSEPSPDTEPLEPTGSALDHTPAPKENQQREGVSNERVLRVTASSINRLMGLAGESLVESRRVQAFTHAVLRLKRPQMELGMLLEKLDRMPSSDGPTAALALAEARSRLLECKRLLTEHLAELEAHARRSDDLSDRLYREALKSRMRPFRDGVQGLPRLVRDVARQLGKTVRLDIAGEATDVDRDVLESLEAPLHHLLRNAIDHGLETPTERCRKGKPEQGLLRVEARHHAGMLAIAVSDDGNGIDPERLRAKITERKLLPADMAARLSSPEVLEFIFLPGFSTAGEVTEISGRGVGLDAVKSAVEAAAGTVRVTSEPGKGTQFLLQLPVTRSVLRAVVVDVAGEPCAFPLLGIERILRIAPESVKSIGNVEYAVVDAENIALISAQQVLGFGPGALKNDEICLVLIGDRKRRYAVVVDKFLGEHDLVVRPLDQRLGKVQDLAAAAILVDGSPALIIDVEDMLRSIEKLAQSGRIDRLGHAGGPARQRKRILVVDDSITVREAERQLLVNRGYEVDVAVDGVDGWNSVKDSRYDLLVVDIDMPRMNGIDLVRTIRQDSRHATLPIIIVSYKDRVEDRLRGLDAGANQYLTKSRFHDDTLVHVVEDLIGAAET
ncbi:MAG TPA: hybrid sensor histidine kinase/response regulator, partial [Polyangiaceae bacterium]|nr:hybrid sensor histidine kinase/response regulator [Polyangiaceae bacterium]